ncbi:MAG: DsbA family protein [Methylocystis sp.]|nr:DsbA family protein [Methylocystis sp.]
MSAAAGLLGAGLAFATPGSMQATEITSGQKAEIEKIVRDYLVANPEVIKEAIEELDHRQKVAEASSRQRGIAQNSDKLLNSAQQAAIGNPAGNVTLVEFFDYNCGYCKRAVDDVAKLVESDPDLRIVLKDFPVLGTGSTEAAQVAAAVRRQFQGQKFWEFHRKLLTTHGAIGKAQALNVAKELGADMDKLERDLKSPEVHAGIEEVMEIADKLNLTGTPSWVLGDEVIVGAVGFSQLKTKVDNVRKCGKTVC